MNQNRSELRAEHLTKNYGKKRVVEDVSMVINSSEIVGLLGPNGAGKTTCFYCIVGLTRLDGGVVSIDGVDLSKAAMHVRARHGLGYLPQEASVFRKLSTLDNVRAIVDLRGDLSKSEKREKISQLMHEFNLEHVASTLGERLSGGERRRVEIARALATEPKFMLLDEPFAGVDPISVAEIKDNVRELSRRDIGVLITDHNVRDTLDLCDRAYIVSDGHVLAEGTPETIAKNERVRHVYLGEQFQL